MKNKTPIKLMTSLLVISLVIFLIGEIFKIQHYPHGNFISLFGLASYIVFSLVEIDKLRKIIAKTEKDDIKA